MQNWLLLGMVDLNIDMVAYIAESQGRQDIDGIISSQFALVSLCTHCSHDKRNGHAATRALYHGCSLGAARGLGAGICCIYEVK